MRPYQRFAAWRHCHALALAVYRVTTGFPSTERYGLIAQARRAAFSAAANIVEGSTKRGKAEFRRFLDTSLGSLAELDYIFQLAAELDMVPTEDLTPIRQLHDEASRTTWGLYKSLTRRPSR